MNKIIENIGKYIVRNLHNIRQIEYCFASKHIEDGSVVLDIGCGTGTFLEYLKPTIKSVGIDINQENIDYCKSKNLNVLHGDALNLNFNDECFDVIHASHLLHVFNSYQTAEFFKECGRVLKKDGSLIISTHNHFPRFFRHPENSRPYPPDALYRLLGILGKRNGATSPMFPGTPVMIKTGLWLRRPSLIDFDSATSVTLGRIFTVLNALQYGCFLRKYWSFDSYIVVFKKVK